MVAGSQVAIAGKATSAMFVAFGRCQLALAALALIGAFLTYVNRRGALSVTLFVLYAIATVGIIDLKGNILGTDSFDSDDP